MRPTLSPRTTRIAFTLAIVAGLLLPVAVAAHSALDVPTPADGSTVEGPPPVIDGTFTQDLADGSSLQLRSADGTAIADGAVDADDPRRMAIEPVPALAPGVYEVRWTTFSAEDGEGPVRGTWSFTVTAQPTPEPTAEPTPSDSPTSEPTAEPSAAASDAPSPAPSPSGDGDPPASDAEVVLPIVAGLAIVVGAGLILLRRRGRAVGA